MSNCIACDLGIPLSYYVYGPFKYGIIFNRLKLQYSEIFDRIVVLSTTEWEIKYGYKKRSI